MPSGPNHLHGSFAIRRAVLTALAPLLAISVLAAACQGSPGSSPARTPPSIVSIAPTPTSSPVSEVDPTLVKIAVFEDLSLEGSGLRVVPALQAVQLRFDQAMASGELGLQVEVVGLDSGGEADQATSLAEGVAADPAYVAAVGAPFFGQQAAVRPPLERVGIPFVSLSTLQPRVGSGWSGWFRAVPDLVAQAGFLADLALARSSGERPQRREVCLAGDGSPISQDLSERVAARLRQHLVLTLTVDQEGVQADGVPSRLESAGCEVLVWTGFSAGAALVRTEMVGAGLEDVPLLGSDAMKDDAYLTATGTAGRRTLVTCPCVDLSTATDLPAQRFIHDYQSEYGGPPGAYAAEAWDVASMLVAALAADGTGGQAVAASLRDLEGFRGLAGKYAFGEGGERDPQGVLEAFMDEGGRWIPWNQAS